MMSVNTALRVVGCALALMTLSSCQRAYGVRARLVDGQVVFSSREIKGTSFARCWRELEVLDSRGRIVWSFDRVESSYEAGRCDPPFPIIYGQPPRGVETEVGAQPLRDGELYVLDGHAGDHVVGAFRLNRATGTIENVEPNSQEGRALISQALRGRWPAPSSH